MVFFRCNLLSIFEINDFQIQRLTHKQYYRENRNGRLVIKFQIL
ncbi:hypothetical protein LEP1GSC016_1612 [Leptospira borgpetersenii serovar Hardjo-bovis str. Sponselee]|uniref:Uncharacterized protein n=1 Tax=Leptospira borgpetersenii serovar Hardjo-bovis str. Sponselee TaxID=1303729 RepID=M6BFC4_LEPBO|nr:hypothetical protein LEP1GSC016_1612 [Leptospira borgpetersenii serovar Hardjo-bovis str. Sponselee]